jgi:hypothetical protein
VARVVDAVCNGVNGGVGIVDGGVSAVAQEEAVGVAAGVLVGPDDLVHIIDAGCSGARGAAEVDVAAFSRQIELALFYDARLDVDPPTNGPAALSPAAQRMRLHRERRRLGLRCLTIQLRETEVVEAWDSEQFRSAPRTCGRFRGNLTLL